MSAKGEDLELKNEITALDKENLSQEEQQAMETAKPMIDVAKAKFAADKTDNKIEFIRFINETYVPADKRQELPGEDVTSVKKKFARWYVSKISKHIHPDNFVNEGKAKIYEMQEISSLNNKIVNKLKGHA